MAQDVPDRDDERESDTAQGGMPGVDSTAPEADHETGQVLGRSVPVSRDVTQAEPGSPETGAVRDEQGRPSARKPMTDS
jgi:hypothetical protein